jgi:hypothetical protein|tara:strand:+ start:548 stop:670 length:123 start_codon:yes stop_codon:yes gene_type:complete
MQESRGYITDLLNERGEKLRCSAKKRAALKKAAQVNREAS